ncbi:hypothetical protein QM285_22475, partial [Stutzerimonas stutzeri]|nr:hypothetical protein [Stutzerimonas stutzeri]
LLPSASISSRRRKQSQPMVSSEQTSAFLRRQQVIGFNTYGEQFNGMHINQTFTGVAIGRPGGRASR